MYHTVYSADIDKRAVAGERLDSTCKTVADSDVFPDLVLRRLALLFKHAADRAYRPVASADFDYAEGNFLALEILKRLAP